ncbi:MAG: helix-turn-helix transcriptional regulator [Treponema sp.]|nr:helix-turn-helix transcriptional regulator [Treponema sp.]
MTTYERLMKNPKFKAEFEKGYNDFLISEFMIEKMEEEKISVRELAKKTKVSPTTIQNLRSGKADSVKLKTLTSVLQNLGYALRPVKLATL